MTAPIERHIITGEYPPDVGGVGDHTAALASALVDCGERIHVWCRGTAGSYSADGVTVHRELGLIRPADLERLSAALASAPAPRRLLVQWVPQAFGSRSLNVAFSRWLYRRRVSSGDDVDLLVHEPYLPFGASSAAIVAATVHRVMIAYVLRAAARVWVVTPAWRPYLRPYAPARDLGFGWLPVPATIPMAAGFPEFVRHRLVPEDDGILIGSFATAGRFSQDALARAILPVMKADAAVHLLLIGRHGEAFRAALLEGDGTLSGRVHATGYVSSGELARSVAACDFGVQPYPDGVCGRQTTAMAFLAYGRPLVTTDGRFTEDVWRQGAVLLSPTSSPEGLRANVNAMVAGRSDRERLSRASRELYESRFAVRHTATALHAALVRS